MGEVRQFNQVIKNATAKSRDPACDNVLILVLGPAHVPVRILDHVIELLRALYLLK